MNASVPIDQQDRLVILDALRGIALCGILIMNVPAFSLPFETFMDLKILNDTSLASKITLMIDGFFLQGSCRALFSILFGAGSVLLVTRLERLSSGLQPADIYYRRLIWLFLFGLFDAYVLLWMGDILYHYALCGLFLFPFRKASNRLIMGIVIFLILITCYKAWIRRNDLLDMKTKGERALALEAKKTKLSETEQEDLKKWKEYTDKNKIENRRKKVEKEIRTMQSPSYTRIWEEVTPLSTKMEAQYMYETIFFDAMICMLLGIVLYRTGILTGMKSARFYLLIMLAGYGLGSLHATTMVYYWFKSDFNSIRFTEIRPIPISLYQLQRICVAMGHIGLVHLLWRSNILAALIRPFIPLGQMAFTNYLMQSVIGTLIFFGYGFALFGKLHRYELWYVVISVWIFQIIFSAIWLRYFYFGPLEWLWRSLTYWERQPMRRV